MSETTPNANGPVLRIENLTKKFGDLEVLHDTNLEVQDKETVVVIGASGSGKTTLLRCVNYLEWPTTGGIYLPENAKDKPQRGTVVSIGNGKLNRQSSAKQS